MKRTLILVAIGFLLCSTVIAFQGGGGKSTKTKADTKKNSGTNSNNTTPAAPPVPSAKRKTPTITSSRDTTAAAIPKANKLVDEGRAAVQDGKKYVADAEEKKHKMLQTDVSQLAEARNLAKEAIAAYAEAEEKCKEAAKKYEEASKLKISDKFKEYLGIKVKEYNKRAELCEAAKGTPQALIDSESHASFVSRANANNEKVDRLSKEADYLAAQADKLQKDNPDIFNP